MAGTGYGFRELYSSCEVRNKLKNGSNVFPFFSFFPVIQVNCSSKHPQHSIDVENANNENDHTPEVFEIKKKGTAVVVQTEYPNIKKGEVEKVRKLKKS